MVFRTITLVFITTALVGYAVGFFAADSGEALAAVLPVVLTGAGIALYRAFGKEEISVVSTCLFMIVFVVFLWVGMGTGISSHEKRERLRLVECSETEKNINKFRDIYGLEPLSYDQVCPKRAR